MDANSKDVHNHCCNTHSLPDLVSLCSLAPADDTVLGKNPQGTSNPALEVWQCPGLEPQGSHTPVKMAITF